MFTVDVKQQYNISVEQKDFRNFGRGSSNEHFFEIIWEYEEMSFKGFPTKSFDGHFVKRSRTILVEVIQGTSL